VEGKPSPRWIYDGCPISPPNSYFTRGSDNNFSWQMARKYYYAAVSGDSTEIDGIGGIVGKVNMNEMERDRAFAYLFRSLGQVMHLVQALETRNIPEMMLTQLSVVLVLKKERLNINIPAHIVQ
jgi:hypothetical protein